ncbi:hypothetical protein DPMN_023852 [Dreissena polymorpha]|uniref:Uncharacterized protein n=1 Tax=Dreissena polymorpha TaxID=45954 RepID=A0A9D4LNN8_DREPO|nr:hypothetical protein DPMN_023852 [Dreissena polymorpha]
MRSHYFPVPPRLKPVNSPAESRSTPDWLRCTPVKSQQSPGCRRYCPGRAPVKAGSVPAEPRYTVTPPALIGAIPASDPGRATATPRLNTYRRR